MKSPEHQAAYIKLPKFTGTTFRRKSFESLHRNATKTKINSGQYEL